MLTELLFWLCAIVFLLSAALTVIVFLALRQIRRLDPSGDHEPPSGESSPGASPELSIVIPARNEAATLEPAMRSLLAQEAIDFEVILVNDHSTDATGEIAERLAAEDSRLRVLHDPELPDGWLGKVNAMQKGAELARAPLLLFSDADIHFKPGCLRAAGREMREHDYEFFSLLPELRFDTVFENALAPAFFLAVPMFAGARLDDPQSPDAVAAGAFLMIRRETYEAIGRHESLRQEVVDDIQLARNVKRAGYRVGLRLAPELLTCRMYLSNRQAFWAVEKNILHSVEGKPWAPYALLPGLMLYAWTGIATAAAGIFLSDLRLLAAGLGLHAFQSMSFLVAQGFYRFRPLKLFLFPMGTISVMACTFKATYHRLHGGVIWRGRVVKLD